MHKVIGKLKQRHRAIEERRLHSSSSSSNSTNEDHSRDFLDHEPPVLHAPSPRTGRRPSLPANRRMSRRLSSSAGSNEHTLHAPCTLPNSEPGTELHFAYSKLDDAIDELEQVLRKVRPSGNLILDAQPGSLASRRVISFADVASDLKSSHEAAQRKIAAQVARFLVSVYPATKLVFGLTSSETGRASAAPLQVIANGLSQILEIAMQPHRNTGDVLNGLDLLLLDQEFLENLQRLPDSAFDRNVLLHAVMLQISLTDFLRESIVWLRKSHGPHVTPADTDPQDVQSSKAELEMARDALRLSISEDLHLSNTWHGIETRDAEKLDAICAQYIHSGHLRMQMRLHEDRLPETGTAILEDAAFKDWLTGRLACLWCSGPAGAGKTFAASATIDALELHIKDSNMGLAYVHCEFDKPNSNTQDAILGAITRQLIARKPGLLKRSFTPGTNWTLQKWNNLMEECCRGFETVFIVVDGLEDYSDQQDKRRQLIRIMRDICIAVGPGRVRLCVTSQDAPGLYDIPQPVQRLIINARESDIIKLTENGFLHSDHAGKMMLRDSWLLEDVTESILRKSNGNFHLASLQLKHALSHSNPNSVRRSLTEFQSMNIHDFYAATFWRILDRKETERITILKLLTWIYHAKTGMSIEQLSIALATDKSAAPNFDNPKKWAINNLNHFIRATEGLVVLSKDVLATKDGQISMEATTCRFAHRTVRTFFSVNESLLLPNGNAMIVEACLKVHSGKLLPTIPQHSCLDPRELYNIASHKRITASRAVAMFWAWAFQWGCYAERAYAENPQIAVQILAYFEKLDNLNPPESRGAAFLICAFHGWTALCRWYLKSGADPNLWHPAIFPNLETPLWAAIKHNQASTVEVLLGESRVDPNAKIKDGRTPLAYLASREPSAALHALLKRPDVQVNEPDERGQTPLLHAALHRRYETMQLLLQRPDIDTNTKSNNGLTPLMALVAQHDSVVRSSMMETFTLTLTALLSNPSLNLNAQHANGMTALHIAASGGHDWLDDRDSTRSVLRRSPFTGPLHLTAVRTLLASGRVDLNLRDAHSRTPLDFANAARVYSARLCASIRQHCREETGRDLDDATLDVREDDFAVLEDGMLPFNMSVVSFDSMYRFCRRMRDTYAELGDVLGAAGGKAGAPFEVNFDD